MTPQPLLSASWAIQLHVYTLVLALVAGTGQFFVTRRGTLIHHVQIFQPTRSHRIFFGTREVLRRQADVSRRPALL